MPSLRLLHLLVGVSFFARWGLMPAESVLWLLLVVVSRTLVQMREVFAMLFRFEVGMVGVNRFLPRGGWLVLESFVAGFLLMPQLALPFRSPFA